MTKNNKSKNESSKKPGRPSKLTPELQAEIILLLKTGNFVETACTTVGINKSTFYDWIKKGKKSNHPHNKYKNFQEAVKKAMAWNEENWRAAAWKLSRKHPQKWGKKEYEDLDLNIQEVDEDIIIINKKDYTVIKAAVDLVASQRKQ
jgi:ABC-type nitrate/sulfonate/bicarbonate transport system substrate-binding protein